MNQKNLHHELKQLTDLGYLEPAQLERIQNEYDSILAFLPLTGVQILLYRKLRSNASDIWIESLTLALGIAFLSAIGLVYQACQLSYSLSTILIMGFLFMLPVIYLLDGYYLAILYLIGICRVGNGIGDDSSQPLLAFLLIPYYRNRIQKRESCRL